MFKHILHQKVHLRSHWHFSIVSLAILTSLGIFAWLEIASFSHVLAQINTSNNLTTYEYLRTDNAANRTETSLINNSIEKTISDMTTGLNANSASNNDSNATLKTSEKTDEDKDKDKDEKDDSNNNSGSNDNGNNNGNGNSNNNSNNSSNTATTTDTTRPTATTTDTTRPTATTTDTTRPTATTTDTTRPTATTDPKIILKLPQSGPVKGFMVIAAVVQNNEKGKIKSLEAYCGNVYLRSLEINKENITAVEWNTLKLPDGLCNFYLKNNKIKSEEVVIKIQNRIVTPPVAIEPIVENKDIKTDEKIVKDIKKTTTTAQTTKDIIKPTTIKITPTSTKAIETNKTTEIKRVTTTTKEIITDKNKLPEITKPRIDTTEVKPVEITKEENPESKIKNRANEVDNQVSEANKQITNKEENNISEETRGQINPIASENQPVGNNINPAGNVVPGNTSAPVMEPSPAMYVVPTPTNNPNLEVLTNVEGLVKEERLVDIDEPIISGEVQKEVFQVTKVETITPEPATPEEPVQPVLKLQGKAIPNSYVILYIYSKPVVVVVKTDNEGNWTYHLDKQLPNGQHEVYVATTNETGKIVSKSEPFTFFIKEAKAVSFEEYTSGAVNVSDPFQKTDEYLKQQIIFISIVVILLIASVTVLYVLATKRQS